MCKRKWLCIIKNGRVYYYTIKYFNLSFITGQIKTKALDCTFNFVVKYAFYRIKLRSHVTRMRLIAVSFNRRFFDEFDVNFLLAKISRNVAHYRLVCRKSALSDVCFAKSIGALVFLLKKRGLEIGQRIRILF